MRIYTTVVCSQRGERERKRSGGGRREEYVQVIQALISRIPVHLSREGGYETEGGGSLAALVDMGSSVVLATLL
jgi:hypothetical protein